MRECPRCERCYEDETLVCPDDQAKTKNTLPGTTLLNVRYRLEKRLRGRAMGPGYLAHGRFGAAPQRDWSDGLWQERGRRLLSRNGIRRRRVALSTIAARRDHHGA